MKTHHWLRTAARLLLQSVFFIVAIERSNGSDVAQHSVLLPSSSDLSCSATHIVTANGGVLLFSRLGSDNNSVNCEWTTPLTTLTNINFELRWKDIRSCNANLCTCDGLVIKTDDGTVQDRICGTSYITKRYFYSNTSYLNFQFYSANGTSGRGFFLTYAFEYVYHSCEYAHIRTSYGGAIDFPLHYVINPELCVWHIGVDQSQNVSAMRLNVSSLYNDIPQNSSHSSNCTSLRMYSMDGALLQAFCGSFSSAIQVSYSGIIIIFAIDRLMDFRGFNLTYSYISDTGFIAEVPLATNQPPPIYFPYCIWDSHTAYSNTRGGFILLPRGGEYSDNIACTWYPTIGRMEVHWTDIEQCSGSGCSCDRLDIEDAASTVVARICGTTDIPMSFSYSPPLNAQLRFNSDESVTKKGFFLTYSNAADAEPCRVGRLDSVLNRIRYPATGYVYNAFCAWHITANDPDKGISFLFSRMEIQRCSSDNYGSLRVYSVDRMYTYLYSFCSGSSSFSIATFGYDQLTLVFDSNGQSVAEGFELRYYFDSGIPKGTIPVRPFTQTTANSYPTTSGAYDLAFPLGIGAVVVVFIIVLLLMYRRSKSRATNATALSLSVRQGATLQQPQTPDLVDVQVAQIEMMDDVPPSYDEAIKEDNLTRIDTTSL